MLQYLEWCFEAVRNFKEVKEVREVGVVKGVEEVKGKEVDDLKMVRKGELVRLHGDISWSRFTVKIRYMQHHEPDTRRVG
jgi:hypothetical protein